MTLQALDRRLLLMSASFSPHSGVFVTFSGRAKPNACMTGLPKGDMESSDAARAAI
jgi:hypothetical protein